MDKEKDTRQDELNALKATFRKTFTGENGKKVLDQLKSLYYYDRPTFVSGISAEELSYREGQRSIVLYINRMLSLDSTNQREATK